MVRICLFQLNRLPLPLPDPGRGGVSCSDSYMSHVAYHWQQRPWSTDGFIPRDSESGIRVGAILGLLCQGPGPVRGDHSTVRRDFGRASFQVAALLCMQPSSQWSLVPASSWSLPFPKTSGRANPYGALTMAHPGL